MHRSGCIRLWQCNVKEPLVKSCSITPANAGVQFIGVKLLLPGCKKITCTRVAQDVRMSRSAWMRGSDLDGMNVSASPGVRGNDDLFRALSVIGLLPASILLRMTRHTDNS